ncbi:outer membrane protein with beta-barrel domain [Chitinophaga dinghuensis]|uniref:Outer membrane protein with beta-barrel domain n=1 Tax=Chitinophaga dinghuensis TaxID=1539050 RepID=A0A327W1R2_9BACT|nr:porin family protein [Chitinophaga dinghuensis]RAJ81964.1 outer membrane protein with beta-barrel domain [Chitinophaga dinghuensis]
MYKKILTSLFLMSGWIFAHGQTFHFGAKADLNLYKVTGEGIKPGYTPGVQLGLFGGWDFNKKFGFQPELLYTQAYSTRDDDFSEKYVNDYNRDGSSHIKLNYVSIPLLLKYNINSRFTINVGPEYSFLFYSNESLLMYNRDAFKRNNLSVVGGVTVNVKPVHFYGRFVQGLTNINGIDDRYSWKTQQIQVGMGVDIR